MAEAAARAAPGGDVEFVVEAGPEQGRVVALPVGRGTIGADPALAHVVLGDPAVAARHLAVDVQPSSQVHVWPIDGAVTVDGEPLRGAAGLRAGSRVRLGGTTLVLRLEGSPAAAVSSAQRGGDRRRAGLVVAVVALVLAGVVLAAGLLATTDAPGALASLLAAVLPAPLLVSLVLAIDRYEPEPRRVLFLTFLYGATAAVLLAGVLNVAGFTFAAVTFGPAVGELLTVTVVAPVVEETLKAVAVLVVFWRLRDQFNGVVDALVYSAMVGLGFAITENVFYYAEALLTGQTAFTAVVVVRGVFSPFAHPLFTSMFGLGLAVAIESARARALGPLVGLVGAIFLHALWNASTFLGAGFFLVYLFVFVPLFGAVVVAAVLASRHEARIIRSHLARDVQTGVLTPGEVDELASARLRRIAEREAARLGSEPAKQAQRAFHHAATRLAFLRHRRARRALHAPGANEEARWVDEVRRRKAAAQAAQRP
jgi:protease PrsW